MVCAPQFLWMLVVCSPLLLELLLVCHLSDCSDQPYLAMVCAPRFLWMLVLYLGPIESYGHNCHRMVTTVIFRHKQCACTCTTLLEHIRSLAMLRGMAFIMLRNIIVGELTGRSLYKACEQVWHSRCGPAGVLKRVGITFCDCALIRPQNYDSTVDLRLRGRA